jgi:hypothetical protein
LTAALKSEKVHEYGLVRVASTSGTLTTEDFVKGQLESIQKSLKDPADRANERRFSAYGMAMVREGLIWVLVRAQPIE